MNRLTTKQLSWNHDPARKGIFVQKNKSKFCVTFPRMGNINQAWEGQVMFPSGDFKTFHQAYCFAMLMREIDSRLSQCKIYLCDTKWLGSVGHREVQQIA